MFIAGAVFNRFSLFAARARISLERK